jgi:nicotinate phosphoribosyltransferase
MNKKKEKQIDVKCSPLLTDQYEINMAQGYWLAGKADQQAVFQLSFRSEPFVGNYVITSGLAEIIKFLGDFSFSDADLEYLAGVKDSNGDLVFQEKFLAALKIMKFSCDIDAMPEGTIAFAGEPLLVIKGPLLQCQLLETILLNLMGFASLVATKASRVCTAAKGDPVIEFGLRRAQGPNGGLTASRSAYIGGCIGTSNVLAGKMYDIPLSGTMAHSWVMAFSNEQEAFHEYANMRLGQTILLVDTYNTIQGTKNAISAGMELRRRKYDLYGVRLDSGNIGKLSKKVRKLLDEAGFINTKILASGDLDENIIAKLKANKSPIDLWGVGSKLVTCNDQSFLNVVYKLMAIYNDHWQYKIKISDQPGKTTVAGVQQIKRFYNERQLVEDIVYDTELGISEIDGTKNLIAKDILVPIFREGKLVYQQPSIHQIREHAMQEVSSFIASKIKKYPVKLDRKLQELQKKIMCCLP